MVLVSGSGIVVSVANAPRLLLSDHSQLLVDVFPTSQCSLAVESFIDAPSDLYFVLS